jgi:hypothetical protein
VIAAVAAAESPFGTVTAIASRAFRGRGWRRRLEDEVEELRERL